MMLPLSSHVDPSWMLAFLPALGWVQFIPMAIAAAKGIYGAVKKKSSAASAAAAGSQDARLKQDQINAQIYNSIVNGELGKGQLDLAQRKFALDAPSTQATQVVRGDLLGNVKDFSMGGPGAGRGSERMAGWTNTGGIRPSAMTDASRQAANLLVQRGLEGLQNPQQFTPADFGPRPTLSQAGTLEKVLGGVGMFGGLLNGIGDVVNNLPSSYKNGKSNNDWTDVQNNVDGGY